jgi:polyhydroxyalkanoate synthase subunit PhaC
LTSWTIATPFEISSYDNPETIRLRKYATGTHLIVHGTEVQTGLTPKEMVWQRGEARLYRYEPTREKKHPIPVLIVYAPILRPYILDLVPTNSFVEYLLDEGFDVYLLDWGNAGPEDKHLSFEDWILDYMPEAVESALSSSQVEELTVFGYCQGGTMSAMYASLFPEEHLKNLILLATPTDFAPEDLRVVDHLDQEQRGLLRSRLDGESLREHPGGLPQASQRDLVLRTRSPTQSRRLLRQDVGARLTQ